MISERVKRIKPSATFTVKAKAQALKAKGIDVLSFGMGEPDFDTPQHVKDGAKKALDDGFTKYTPSIGISELRQAIAEKTKKINKIDCSAGNVLVSNGAKHCLHNVFQTMLNPGDETIVLSPYWVSYPDQVEISEGKPVIVETDEEFQPVVDSIREAVSDKTKLLVVNSPCNPTGAVFGKDALKEIAELALEKDFFIVSDECYEEFVYDGAKHYSIASFSPEIAEKTITVNSLSKTYAMTGWRVGYVVASEHLIKAMASLQGQTTSNVNSIAQKAAVVALQGGLDYVKEMAAAFDERRKVALNGFNSIDEIKCNKPQGAFYLFPYVNQAFKGEIDGSASFCDFLIEKAHVALVPGVAFGNDRCVRFSYGNTSIESINEGISRIEKALKQL